MIRWDEKYEVTTDMLCPCYYHQHTRSHGRLVAIEKGVNGEQPTSGGFLVRQELDMGGMECMREKGIG